MNEVREFPESKHHQSRFLSLKSDFETIIKTLEEQQYVLFALDGSISEDESKSVIVEIMRRSKGRESSITEFSLQTTKEALTCFREMERKRAQLESWVSPILSSTIPYSPCPLMKKLLTLSP